MAEYYKGMPNEEYWANRVQELEESVFNDTNKMNRELDRVYSQQIKEIEDTINSFVARYATADGKLDYQKVTSDLLTDIDMIEYRNKINTLTEIYKQTGDEAIMAEMNMLRSRQKVTLWQSLIDEITARRGKLSIEQSAILEEHLMATYTSIFEQMAYSLAVTTDIAQIFTMPNEEALKQLIKYPLSGEQFSSRIWKNNDSLIGKLKEELVRSAVQGESIPKISKRLRKYLVDSEGKYRDYNTKRLARTETAFIMESASVDTYKEVEMKKLEVICSLDERTCKICGKHDGDIVEVDKAQAGKNVPPFHPQCRCTTVPYIKDYKGTRVDMSKEGITYGTNSLGNKVIAGRRKVPSEMKFEEWKSIYLDKSMSYEEWLEMRKPKQDTIALNEM